VKKLENKTVFITGGLSGIGKACAIAAAREGANIAIVDIRSANTDDETKKWSYCKYVFYFG
jgi:NAD(P)-dependent dehydrogenase (short-subunit alcohol dehydrogenase family)